MKAKDRVRVDALRAALSAFSYKKIEAGRDISEDDQLEVVRKQVKQRTDSISEFEKAGRSELVAKETREREILQAYLPQQKSRDEIRAVVRAALAAIPGESRNPGSVMKAVMPQLRGLADGNAVREVVGEELRA